MQKLLIVEDDQSVRTTMVTCLELEGYTVEALSSTHEAIDRLEHYSYPIVISDIYLDERTGIDVLRTARRQNPACAVILMTGRGSMETVMAATEGGAFEYLAQPVEMAHMIDTIIGDIDLGFQLKLLRFLQQREVRPLGSARARKVDVRIIAATNRDVQKLVDEGKFREDLWYRLNVVRLVVPPLCERPSDIPLLVHYFLKRYNERYKLDTRLTDSGLKTLEEYSWPGNIRQLQHMMERLAILAPGGRIDTPAVRHAIEQMDSRESSSETLADTEAEQIRRVLGATNGNKSRAAKILGIERKTLYRKLEKMAL